jgi:hypothetical protein
MEQTECSETSAYKIQTPGNYPEENIQHTEHGESLKSRTLLILSAYVSAAWPLSALWTQQGKKKTSVYPLFPRLRRHLSY